MGKVGGMKPGNATRTEIQFREPKDISRTCSASHDPHDLKVVSSFLLDRLVFNLERLSVQLYVVYFGVASCFKEL